MLFIIEIRKEEWLITVEEIEIIVTAKVEEALKEFQKFLPAIKQTMKQAQEAFSRVDTKTMTNKLHQAVSFMKKKMQDLKKSSQNNEITIKVNNKDAQRQISQIQKQIDSLQEKINARQMKLNIINPQIDKIVDDTRKSVTPEGIHTNNKAMDTTVDNALGANKDFTTLNGQAQKMYTEIEMYNKQLSEAKNKMAQLKQEINKTATTQNKLGRFFDVFKQKIEQVKPSISNMKNSFKGLPKITQNITNNIKGMGTGLRNGLGHILKYAMALFSLRGIYSILSSCASTWLSSQNAGAKQLSANIDYMKYAMGSALAPIIQWVTNLVYQLMKAIQSVTYALTGVNIFAKASANSYASMAKSAKKAKNETKQLAGVHNEINNVQENNNSDSGSEGNLTPSFDLSQMDNTPNSIIDAIKNGNWYEVGATIGQKLNDAMNSIPWDKIQNTAKNIGTNIAQFLNGFIATTDWNEVGNTFAQGLNTVIYFGYSFITTFDWKQFGQAIGDSINGFFKNVDWVTAGKTLGEGIKGIFNILSTAIQEIDWAGIGQDIVAFITNIDWSGVVAGLCESLGAALGGISATIASILLEAIIYPLSDFFLEKTSECGGNVVLGLLKGIAEGLIGIGEWIYNNMIYPLISAFCNALGIHSPSTVFMEFGQFIIQGLLNGITSLVDNVKQIWENIKNTAVQIFNDIKNSISNIWQQVTSKTTETWQNIKNNVKEGAQGAWNGITSIFNNIPNWFRDKFTQAWQAVKNVFSTGGRIFDGIKEGILSGLKAIVNAIINGINKVIAIPFNGLNTALRTIRSANIMGLTPFSWISTIAIPQIQRLAKGNVAYDETLAIFGEYPGASNNPEITTPQNIMRDTFEDVLSNYSGNGDDRPIYLTVKVGDSTLGQILLDDLRDKKRRTGKDIEALIGG